MTPARSVRWRLAVEHLDEGLDDRLAAGVPLRLDRLDQLAERQVLMGVGAEGRLADPRQQLAAGRVAREVEREGDLGQEGADHRLDLGPVPVGVVRPQDQLLLAGVAVEQRRQGGEHGHEQGGPLLPGEGPQRFGQLGRDVQQPPPAPHPHHGGARPVGRQLERQGEALQPLPPPGDQIRQHLALEPLALPDGEVRVLDRRLRQRRRPARREGGVERGQLGPDDLEGEEVDDQVVRRQQADVVSAG